MSHRGWSAVFGSLLALVAPAWAETPSPTDVARKLELSDDAIERVKNGEVVFQEIEASSDKDLSMALVAAFEAPLDRVKKFVETEEMARLSTVTIAQGKIDTGTFSLAAARADDQRPSVLQLLSGTPFATGDAERVIEGEVVITPVEGLSNRELAVGIACLMPSRSEDFEPFDPARPMLPSALIERFGELKPTDAFAALEKVELTEAGREEMRRFLTFEPGLGLNLSAEERSAFAKLARPAGELPDGERIADEVRRLLATRTRRYHEAGLDGIAPYLRADGRVAETGEELRRTLGEAHAMERRFPAFIDFWNRYPKVALPGAREHFFWIQSTVRDRPAVLLAHQARWRDGETWLIGERHFYVSHFFNGGYAFAVVTPAREGLLFAMMERLWVDGYSGMANLKKKVGRRLLARRLGDEIRQRKACRGDD